MRQTACKHLLPGNQCLQCSEDEITRLSAEVERLTQIDKVKGDRVVALSNALARQQAENIQLRADLEAKTAEVERLKPYESDYEGLRNMCGIKPAECLADYIEDLRCIVEQLRADLEVAQTALATARAWIDGSDHYPACPALVSRDASRCACGWSGLLERGAP